MTMLFVASFEFGPGPIVWLYNGEILNNKAISVAVFLNWVFTLLVGYFTP
jgi:SP family facilitated glucose transporter-like MFS transporter 1